MKTHFTIFTEEFPNVNSINYMFKKISEYGEYSNNDIQDIGNNNTYFIHKNGIYIKILICSGNTSFLDYYLCKGNINIVKDINIIEQTITQNLLCVLEDTKTDPTESRNTCSSQRFTKFAICNIFFKRNIPSIMFFNKKWNVDMLPPSNIIDFQVYKTLNIDCVYYDNNKYIDISEKYNIKPIDDVYKYIGTLKFTKNPPKSNTKIGIIVKQPNIYHINIKLDKGNGPLKGKISHDPNIGKLIMMISVIHYFDKKAEIQIYNHGVTEANIIKCKNKLIKFISNSNLSVSFIISEKKISPPKCEIKKYFKFKVLEKHSTILFHFKYAEHIIFSNHGGCALSYLKYNDIQIKINRNETRPDIVLYFKDTNTCYIIEGKIVSNISKGPKQLTDTHLSSFIELLKNTINEDITIKKGLCIFSDKQKIDDNYGDYPVYFKMYGNNNSFEDKLKDELKD